MNDGNTIIKGATLKVAGKWFTVERITAEKVYGFVRRRTSGIYNTTTPVTHNRATLVAEGYKFCD